MSHLVVSTQTTVWLFAPVLAAVLLTAFNVWLSGRYATKIAKAQNLVAEKNARAQNELAEKNAKAQNDLAAKMKLADFRQGWINELRDCLAEFQSRGMSNQYSESERPELIRLAQKIRLLMNNQDASYLQLSQSMDLLISNSYPQARKNVIVDMTTLAQKVLKDEWKVLKRDLGYKQPSDDQASKDSA